MKTKLSDTTFSVTKAAEKLKVSPDTLRRLETKEKFVAQRTPGGTRFYTKENINFLKQILNKPA